ncbi:hypothetical protein KC685_02295 [Candidatus Dojkabacteria bacterium]|uniref:Uncharacterized protein n=1 Tax=Candidatus Dojkabacteria bacterium TaxID=2099670 RepID=A0A955KX51_9BACT|nr:hypothetical protein [Candidatus Dojkabacteria bacterium]
MNTEQFVPGEYGVSISDRVLGRLIEVFGSAALTGSQDSQWHIYPNSHEALDGISHTITYEQIQAFSPAMLLVLLLIIEESDEESYLAAMENQAYSPTYTRTAETDEELYSDLDEVPQNHATGLIQDLLALKLCDTDMVPGFANDVARYLSTDPALSIATLGRPLAKIRDVFYQIQIKDSALFEANLRCFLDRSYMIDPNWGLVVESFLNNPFLEFEKIPPNSLESATTTVFSKNQDLFNHVIDYLLFHIRTQPLSRKQVDNIVSLLLHNFEAGNDVMIAFDMLIHRRGANFDILVFAEKNPEVSKKILEHIFHLLLTEPNTNYPVDVQKTLVEGWILLVSLPVLEICRIPFAKEILEKYASSLKIPPGVAVGRLTKQQDTQQVLVSKEECQGSRRIPATHYLPTEITTRLISHFQWEELSTVGIDLDKLSLVQVFQLIFWFWTNGYDFDIYYGIPAQNPDRSIPIFVKNLSKHLEHLLKRSNAGELDSFCQVLAEKLNHGEPTAGINPYIYADTVSRFLVEYIEPELRLTLLKSLQCVDYPTAIVLAHNLNMEQELYQNPPDQKIPVINAIRSDAEFSLNVLRTIIDNNHEYPNTPSHVYLLLLRKSLFPRGNKLFTMTDKTLLRKILGKVERSDRNQILDELIERIFWTYSQQTQDLLRLSAFLELATPSEVYAFYRKLYFIGQEDPRMREHVLKHTKLLMGTLPIANKIAMASKSLPRPYGRGFGSSFK